jgi:ABC-type nitrate/sulfonate/bicarbonate transport system ATPase subunit
MTTTDTEKVQLRHQALSVDESGEAELDISVKNISSAKSDAAVLVTFSTHNDAFIGDKVLILRDIGPDEIRRFTFKYKPHSDAIVDKYSIRIVSDLSDMIEEVK